MRALDEEQLLQIEGRIFDIQRYSIHDGPGIRTIVFLKGCVLHCRWCCNPEGQKFAIQTMVENGKPNVVGKDVTVHKIMETVEKDRPYYWRSGGGLTLSGGECLCQPEFAASLLKAAKMSGINTAIESTGCVDYSVIEGIIPYVDTFLMDIKHINGEKHREFCGRSNELILENANRISASGMTNLVIRVPVIPTFNDTLEEIADIARFADTLSGVKQIHLLPYHRLARGKYEGLGIPYLMEEVLPPTNEHMALLKNTVEQNSSLQCQIGG